MDLSLPADASAILRLPSPPESFLKSASQGELGETARKFRRLWLQLALDIKLGSKLPSAVAPPSYGFWELLRRLAGYYGYSLLRYGEDAGPGSAREIIDEAPIQAVYTLDDRSGGTLVALRRITAISALNTVDLCLWRMFFADDIDEMDLLPGELTEDFDAECKALEALRSLQSWGNEHTSPLAELANELLEYALDYRVGAVKRRVKRHQRASRHYISLVRPRELEWLGERDPLMLEKYGSKKVELIFERKLALVFQSFGFTVVPARPGEVNADLLCIAREQRFCFFVEAKSSQRPYVLPKADQRAIRDYVSEFSSELPDLPPLAFVLLVSGGAAGTVEGKLKRLEGDIGMPIRFISAALLGELRQGLPGPILPAKFKTAVVDSEPILGEEIVKRSKDALESMNSAYKVFLTSLKRQAAS